MAPACTEIPRLMQLADKYFELGRVMLAAGLVHDVVMMHHDVAAGGVRIAAARRVAVAAGPAATRDGTAGGASSAARHVVFGDHNLTKGSEPLSAL